MSRSAYSVLGLASMVLLWGACGGGEDSNGDAAIVADASSQSEAGGVGRGRGNGGLGEGDGGDEGADASADVQPDSAVAKDAMSVPDTAPSCVPATCDAIADRYQKALAGAKGCRTASSGQCAVSVASDLACGCNIWVNTDSTLKPIAKEWEENNCGKCKRLCPLIACKNLTTGVCQKNATTTAATIIDPVIINPPIIIVPNDGTCANKSLVIQPVPL